ncbi:CPBP family glutamic-type intramembrane protease [Sphingobacterium corticibacter]|uniref:CPBP family intramembrane metalloprotease n=1 Tax=Sphingobacterium corticibacter TaxID=2171749 RepID=A0A2T8HJA8_9SPHI|nr:CPBP family glutamic-type intramembrane protease [Sphingobacterium corticibacter]PVH25483.1 CPBP family intramembrane metalloprotease [Sphingobacterium corticibacter]
MKMSNTFKLGLLIFGLGFIGILTLLTMEMSIPPSVLEKTGRSLTLREFKLIALINPTVLLLIMVVIGTLTYKRVGLPIPIFEKLVYKESKNIDYRSLVVYGVKGGIATGLFLVFFSFYSSKYITLEIDYFTPNILNRLFYGGVTEEVLLRFGVMSLFIWLLSLLFKSKPNWIYWAGILLAGLLFGLGHLPVVFNAMADPSLAVILYIVFGNMVGGSIFGWLYWKKGLESAMIAHAFAHVIMLSLGAG